MSAAITNTWVGSPSSPARRPSLADLGGAVLEDDAKDPPPKDGTHQYAAMPNQWQLQLESICRVIAPAIFTLDFLAGAPFIDVLDAMDKNLVKTPGVDFAITDNGVGDTTITWADYKLPPKSRSPRVTVNDLSIASPGVEADYVAAAAGFVAVRVKTKSAGAGADLRVTIEL
jgi:hypothetical protein